MNREALSATVASLVQLGKGLLAADESIPTLTRRFRAVGIEPTEENRRRYRELLFTTPGISSFLSGVILFEESFDQRAADGRLLPEILKGLGILPGIKVDKGLTPLAGGEPDEQATEGLDGLAGRLETYRGKGARFAKWRAVYRIGPRTPSRLALAVNAQGLAHYAALCQGAALLPIVEPEVLIEGDHSIERCAEVTEEVLCELFYALHRQRVVLEHLLLKPSMVLSGKGCPRRASREEVADITLAVLRRVVPAAVPGIFFLSGGQSPQEATAHLSAMNRHPGPPPWPIAFSYARALQEPVMALWRGEEANTDAAREALRIRGELNSKACWGEYNETMEPT